MCLGIFVILDEGSIEEGPLAHYPKLILGNDYETPIFHLCSPRQASAWEHSKREKVANSPNLAGKRGNVSFPKP